MLCVVAVSAAVLAVPFVLSSLAVGPDAIGVDIATAVMGGDGDALVATGLAVQSQYPWAMMTGGGKGWAQVTNDELGGKNPFSPSVSINIMEKRITDGIKACTKCAAGSDLLVVAALAQNGFDPQLFKFVQKNKENNTLDWIGFLDAYGDTTRDPFAKMRQTLTRRNFETELMLKIYMQDLREMLSLQRRFILLRHVEYYYDVLRRGGLEDDAGCLL